MKIRMTFDFDLRVRKAIGAHYGRPWPATWEECRRTIDSLITADIGVITSEFDNQTCENCGCLAHLPKKCDACECIWGRA